VAFPSLPRAQGRKRGKKKNRRGENSGEEEGGRGGKTVTLSLLLLTLKGGKKKP